MRGGLSAVLPVPAFIQDKFPEFAARLDGDGAVGVAVSGGGDSVALLYALAAWNKRPLQVFCVDHGLNSLSAQWTQSVADHAARVGAGFSALYWQGEKPATGLSAAARLARHRLLSEAAREKGVSVLCLAHTIDDIAEAQAMRAQGSNVGAPKAWAPAPVWPEGHDVFLYRPFLDVRREALREYLRGIGVTWIDDPANENPLSLRARTRKALRQQPLDVSAREDEATITAGGLHDLLYQPQDLAPLGMIAFNAAALDALPREMALKLLGTAAVCAGGGDKLPGRDKITALLENLALGRPLNLAGARIVRRDGLITLSREPGDIGRNRPAVCALNETDATVWDGRFFVRSAQVGEVVASGRVRGNLTEADRAWLMRLPADLRGTQPVFVPAAQNNNQNKYLLTNPALRQGAYGAITARCLVGSRLRAALGLITTESAVISAKSDCVFTPINGV